MRGQAVRRPDQVRRQNGLGKRRITAPPAAGPMPCASRSDSVCCNPVFGVAKRIDEREAASPLASASARTPLLLLTKGLAEPRRVQPDPTADRSRRVSEVVRADAGLHAPHARMKNREEDVPWLAARLPAEHGITVLNLAVRMERMLLEIDAVQRHAFHDNPGLSGAPCSVSVHRVKATIPLGPPREER